MRDDNLLAELRHRTAGHEAMLVTKASSDYFLDTEAGMHMRTHTVHALTSTHPSRQPSTLLRAHGLFDDDVITSPLYNSIGEMVNKR